MKSLKILSVLLLTVVFFGCGKDDSSNKAPADQNSQAQEENQASSKKENGSNLISDIKEAIANNQEMKCSVSDSENQTSSTVYISGKKYKSEVEINGEKFYSVSDGEDIYTWSDGKEGSVKINIDCMENIGNEVVDQEDYKATSEEFVDEYENNITCQPTSGTDFSAPENIEFEDLCATLQRQMEQFNEMKKNLPNLPDDLQLPQ